MTFINKIIILQKTNKIMAKKGTLRCAFYSMLATIISVLVLFYIYKHNIIGRDTAMLVELGILVIGISYNFSKLDAYLERYADVKSFYNILSILCICISIYIYFQSKELFYFITGITFTSVVITLALWIKNLRKEIR